ncbi:hypothetical protein T439DRAFT_221524 [Meredithblackwellia eburnea MCA 4105]
MFRHLTLLAAFCSVVPFSLALPSPREWASRNGGQVVPHQGGLPPHSNTTLYLRTIGVDESTGFAKPDCWAIQPNYTVGTDASLLGTLDVSLGPVQTSSYVYFPEDFAAPLHGPGGNQYVIFLSGYATIYFPNATGTIPCPAGTNLVVVDNSTVSTGHYTNWTAGTSVVLVQFQGGNPPAHESVSTSLCGF